MARVFRTSATQATTAPGTQTRGAPGPVSPSARWAISLSLILGCLTHSVMMGSINIAVRVCGVAVSLVRVLGAEVTP